jgi:hypothetical protein
MNKGIIARNKGVKELKCQSELTSLKGFTESGYMAFRYE